MASAAAVGADATGSPLREYEVAEGFSGAIKSVTPPPADDDADIQEDLDDDDAGLFGDGDDEGVVSPKTRQLDDAELDSADDEGRDDRARQYNDYGDEVQQEEVEDVVLDIELGRHPIPKSSDGELYLLKIPQFLGIEPHAFSPLTFQAPAREHHAKEASNTFSAYNTALSTIRWRHSPSSKSDLQSNARILRWSDGSLTLQFAHDPTKQYRIPGNPLAPPQRNPPKPTPLSSRKDRRGNAGYTAEKDSFMYLLAPQAQAQILRTTNKLTTSLLIHPPDEPNERAVEALQLALAKAQGGGMGDAGLNIIHISEDPELAKKKAELAEKEKERARKRREGQEARNRDRQDRGGRPSGFGGGRGGLTLEGLEDDELGAGVGRVRSTKPRAKPKRKPNRRGEILTDEEEEGYGARARTREDEYDDEDGFLVNDEDEEEVGEDGDEEEEEEEEDIDEGIDLESIRKKTKSPKRTREEEQDDLDAEGEADDEVDEGAVARSKRRRVIEDDDE